MLGEDVSKRAGCSKELLEDRIGDLLAATLPVFDIFRIRGFDMTSPVGKTLLFEPKLSVIPMIKLDSLKTAVEFDEFEEGFCVQMYESLDESSYLLVMLRETAEKCLFAIRIKKARVN